MRLYSCTKDERQGFPEKAIAIGDDGGGNYLIFLEEENIILGEALYFWDHESNGIEKVADNIEELTK